jgi:hypothetical protein
MVYAMAEEMKKTSASLPIDKYQKFRAICSLKFKKDMMTKGFNEAVDLFIEENKHLIGK